MKNYGEIRNSQLITTFGIGSIFNSRNNSVMILGLDEWNISDLKEIRESRLERKLGVEKFMQPSSDDDHSDKYIIPSRVFPEWVFCPKCKKLGHYKKHFGGENYCRRCFSHKAQDKKRLVPARFILACPKGHIKDFPWEWWVHRGNICKKPDLYITTSARSVSLASIIVGCKNCKGENGKNTSRNLSGIFRRNTFSSLKCSGDSPWLGPDFTESCNETPRALQRGSSAVYYPLMESSISIPPFSSIYQKLIEKAIPAIAALKDNPELQIAILNNYIKQDSAQISAEELLEIINEQNNILKNQPEELKTDEYKVLLNPGRFSERSDFIAEHENIPDEYINIVTRVILLRKIRIVTALTGFNRIRRDNNRIAPLSRHKSFWLPAAEVLGEGIFIKY